MIKLRHKGRRRARLVAPVGGENAGALVVARQTVHTGLDQNEAELGVGVLAVLLQVLAHADSLLDEVVQILGQLGRETLNVRQKEFVFQGADKEWI